MLYFGFFQGYRSVNGQVLDQASLRHKGEHCVRVFLCTKYSMPPGFSVEELWSGETGLDMKGTHYLGYAYGDQAFFLNRQTAARNGGGF